MLVILNDFVTRCSVPLKEGVVKQKEYNEQNPLSENIYSIYEWEDYESDDDEGKHVATVPVDYASLIFQLVVVWSSKFKEGYLRCPCHPLFQWSEQFFCQERGKTGGFLPGEEYMWQCTLPSWAVWLKDAGNCHNVQKNGVQPNSSLVIVAIV